MCSLMIDQYDACLEPNNIIYLYTALIEDGPYGGIYGYPWTDINTFIKNGQITAMEIRSGSSIHAIRARYSIKVTKLFCH